MSRSRPAALLLVGTAVSATSGYAFVVLASRSLGEASFAPIATLWSFQYLLFATALYPLELVMARNGDAKRQPFRQVLSAALLIGLLATCGYVVLVPEETSVRAGLVVLLVLSYCGYVMTRGWLSARRDDRGYAVATMAEGAVRLLLLMALMFLGVTVAGVAAIVPAGALVVTLYGLRVMTRDHALAAPRPGVHGVWSFLGPQWVANSVGQGLLALPPLLLAATGSAPPAVSTAFVVFTLARAPLLLGYGGLLTRLVRPTLQAEGDAARLALRALAHRMSGISLALAGCAGLLCLPLGPAAIGLLFGDGFAPPGLLVALAAASGVLALANMTLSVAVAGHTRARTSVLPWIVAAVVAVACGFVLPLEPLERAGLAVLLAEVVALIGLSTVALTSAGYMARSRPAVGP